MHELVVLALLSTARLEVAIDVDVEAWNQHVTRLASDAMEGRAPGTPGGDGAARYIADQFEEAGLSPGGNMGYLKTVPLPAERGGGASANVVGMLPGRDRAAEAVVVTAHYDAYGIGEPDETGDSIYNGALDNACGVAALIEIARHYAGLDTPRARTLVFIATTAEEGGSHGLRHYVEHPTVELLDTIVNINIDGINVVGPTEDFLVFPSEGTETRAALESIGSTVGMSLRAEPWQKRMHFAFDTRAFLERGVVGITLWQGSRFRELTPPEASERRERFGQIHTPGDEWSDGWDPSAVTQHILLYIAAVDHYASDVPRPRLSEKNPFTERMWD